MTPALMGLSAAYVVVVTVAVLRMRAVDRRHRTRRAELRRALDTEARRATYRAGGGIR